MLRILISLIILGSFAKASTERELVQSAIAAHRAYLLKPEGVSKESGKSLETLFEEALDRVVKQKTVSNMSVEFLVNLVFGHSSEKAAIGLAEIWTKNDIGEQFLIRHYILDRLDYALKFENYDRVLLLSMFTVKFLYVPGDTEVSTLLFHLFQTPLHKHEMSRILRILDARSEDQQFEISMFNKDTALYDIYLEKSLLLALSGYELALRQGRPDLFWEDIRTGAVTRIIKNGLSVNEQEIRELAMKVTLEILLWNVSGVVDRELLQLTEETKSLNQVILRQEILKALPEVEFKKSLSCSDLLSNVKMIH